MKTKLRKLFSFVLVFLIMFNIVSPICMPVFAEESASQRSKNFLNFVQNKDKATLEMADLTTQDYFAMFTFMSNWYQPGVTTLRDIYPKNKEDVADKHFFKEFAKTLGIPSETQFLQDLVVTYGSDTVTAITDGCGVLIDKDGTRLTGKGLLNAILGTIEVKDTNQMTVKSEYAIDSVESYDTKVYFMDGGIKKTAFDFKSNAVRAAFQTVLAYNPDMFLWKSGIQSLTSLYIDNMGNLWGGKSVEATENTTNTGSLDVNKLENMFLILPACLNPATFTPNATEQNQLRMPLMNRFVLSSMLSEHDLRGKADTKPDFSEKYVPIYNVLVGEGMEQQSILGVIGIHSLSPYTLNTGDISTGNTTGNTTFDRKESLAAFLYNPKNFIVAKSTEAITSKASIKSNSYIAFLMGINSLNANNAKDNASVWDFNTGFWSVVGDKKGDLAFTVFSDETIGDSVVFKQQQLFTYFFTPTLLSLNEVSMNFFRYEPETDTDISVDEQYSTYFTDDMLMKKQEVTDSTIPEVTDSNIPQLGLAGMSLFLNDVSAAVTENGLDFYSTGPDNMVTSKFVQEISVLGSEGLHNTAAYIAAKKGECTSAFLKWLFLNGTLLNGTLYNYAGLQDFVGTSVNEKVTDPKMPSIFLPSDNANGDNHMALFLNGNTGDDADDATKFKLYLNPNVSTFINVGNAKSDITLSKLLGQNDKPIKTSISSLSDKLSEKTAKDLVIELTNSNQVADYLLALYGYSLFFPSSSFFGISGSKDGVLSSIGNKDEFKVGNLGFWDTDEDKHVNNQSGIFMKTFSGSFLSGVYLGYVVDMMGITRCDSVTGVSFGSFKSKFLPEYSTSAKGGDLALKGKTSNITPGTGIDKSEDTSFEQKQKDLINRIYGLTNDKNNDYRNNLIKNILEGFILTVHRTITGTWGAGISTVSTGSTSTYQGVTGFIYTPTLEELSFTAPIMNRYMEIYIVCLLLISFVIVLMVLLHMRTWKQGVAIASIMCVALLFPYILISNTVNVSNKVSDSVYTDRFDFWALTEHLQSVTSLKGAQFQSDKDKWLIEASATTDVTRLGEAGVKMKWMAPKKVEMFKNLYSDSSLSQSFVTNMQIFKWLFSSTIYDSEFVDVDVLGSYVYRSYNNIALEAESYYNWGRKIETQESIYKLDKEVTYKEQKYTVYGAFDDCFKCLDESQKSLFGAGLGRINPLFYTDTTKYGSNLKYTIDRYADILKVSQLGDDNNQTADKIGLWGMYSSEVNKALGDNYSTQNRKNPGILSNLPMQSYSLDEFEEKRAEDASKAIYLKNTESPFYYFYSVLASRYSTNPASIVGSNFKEALLKNKIFKIDENTTSLKTTTKSVNNAFRDFLDLEGLFEYVIPYLHLGNNYVSDWKLANPDEISQYNFDYTVNEQGDIIMGDSGGTITDGAISNTDYGKAVEMKNAENRVWNMYSPWVDSLYDLNVTNKKVTVGGKTLYIADTLNPTSYIDVGRPMLFSEADMIVRGYSYKDLTDVERRLQAVTEKTYNDLLYLVNYYDMDDRVLIAAAAMYATFNFNTEFSDSSFFGESVMLYPQGFELKNFNYDAFMRLALLNSTGESVFATDDLYVRILSKTSVFTGILLLVSDLLACVLIPAFKFIILLGLLFLGLLVCVTCVVNPPDKIFKAVSKSLLFPSILFMGANIVFSVLMSFIVGEGLTSYVGSKGVTLATNDPSMTMLLIILLGGLYTFCLFKILMLIFKAYKEYGMSSIFALGGIIGGAVAAGTSGIRKVAGRVGSMGLGAALAGKGNRLQGAADGAMNGNMLKNTLTSQRNARVASNRKKTGLDGALPEDAKYTDKLNKAAEGGSGTSTGESTTGGKKNKNGRAEKEEKDRKDKLASATKDVTKRKTGEKIVPAKVIDKYYNARSKISGAQKSMQERIDNKKSGTGSQKLKYGQKVGNYRDAKRAEYLHTYGKSVPVTPTITVPTKKKNNNGSNGSNRSNKSNHPSKSNHSGNSSKKRKANGKVHRHK